MARGHRVERGPALGMGMGSVLERGQKRELARRGPVQHGVLGVTGQAVLLHVEKE